MAHTWHGHGTWTWYMDMVHGHGHGTWHMAHGTWTWTWHGTCMAHANARASRVEPPCRAFHPPLSPTQPPTSTTPSPSPPTLALTPTLTPALTPTLGLSRQVPRRESQLRWRRDAHSAAHPARVLRRPGEGHTCLLDSLPRLYFHRGHCATYLLCIDCPSSSPPSSPSCTTAGTTSGARRSSRSAPACSSAV